MRPASLLIATLALVATAFLSPAGAQDAPLQDLAPAAEAAGPTPCPTGLEGAHVAQIHCCKANKGICGCRAGKIVCCDGSASTEAGCTCRGDDAAIE